MTAIDDLLGELKVILETRDIGYAEISAANDIYEGFVFSLVIDAARSAGAAVSYWTVGGAQTLNLVFRTSPGLIGSTTHAYTHAVLQFPKSEPLEVHVGVRVQGKSGVLHECDVVVLAKSEADHARIQKRSPRGTYCLIGIECKYYSSNLGIELARGFIGMHADLGLQKPVFVANVFSASIERYLTYLKKGWEHGVVPHSSEATYLKGQFREVFKQYRAMQGSLGS